MTEGRKDDLGKADYSLIPPLALDALARVLTFGAKKYAPENWRVVPDRRRRYFSAAMRHLWLWWRGEQKDVETGESHLAHALCCVVFLLDEEEQPVPAHPWDEEHPRHEWVASFNDHTPACVVCGKDFKHEIHSEQG